MSVTTYVPLHAHSYFSVLDGLNSPEQVAEAAKKLGCPAAALTDHGTCAGLFRFHKACKEQGIKPILGMETYYVDGNMEEQPKGETRRHVTLWAKNKTGYRNLLELSSQAYLRGFYYRPRIDFETLKRYSEGLIVGSGCASGVVCGPILDGDLATAESNADKFLAHFGDDFYMEIMLHKYFPEMDEKKKQFHDAMAECGKMAKRKNIQLIYTHDSHYCYAEDYDVHDVLLSISTLNTIKNPKRFTFHSNDFYMKSVAELVPLLNKRADHTYMLENTVKLAEKVEDGVLQTYPARELMPKFVLPAGETDQQEYLKALVASGLRAKGVYDKPEYQERMEYELSVIQKCGYASYFLILWDVVEHARREGIRVGPGRGSGVASLCLYAINVTALDPVKYRLAFERFLNPDRISPPDVDMDFEFTKRDELFRYVAQKYGSDNVCRIGTYGKLKAKDAIKRVGKAMDVGGDYEAADEKERGRSDWRSGKNTLHVIDQISKCIPNVPDMTVDLAIQSFKELQPYVQLYPKVFAAARKIEGTIASQGVHAAGIVICKDPIVNYVPLRISDSVICTQFDMHEVEGVGLLKYDFLALKNLTMTEQCLQMIKKRYDITIDPNKLEPDDPKVFDVLNRGDTEGIFQFEGASITRLAHDVHIDTFNDMVVVNALHRPPTLKAKIDKAYIAYKFNQKKVTYVHPKMETVLKDTYGMMIYQEDVMMVAMKLAGFTASEADTLRKGIGKKKAHYITELKSKFVTGCIKNGIDKSTAEKIYKLCEFFAGYGFNKSHAAAYAYTAYQNAYLKHYFPLEFMCSLLSVNLGAADADEKIAMYEAAAKKSTMGIKILPANINKSGMTYVIEGEKELRRPLTILKGVGEKAVQSIVQHQPYINIHDFISKVDLRLVNTRVVDALIQNGCMESFGMAKKEAQHQYELAMAQRKKDTAKASRIAKKRQAEKNSGPTLFDIDLPG